MRQEQQFLEVINLIKQARANAYRAANTEMINTYWQVGEYLSFKITNAKWGDKTVSQLAEYISRHYPDLKGFNRRGLYRMRQFYETYVAMQIVSSAMTQLQNTENQHIEIVSPEMTQFQPTDIRHTIIAKASWTHHLVLIGRPRTNEEREFYLRLTIQENYTVKELERQINSSLYERVLLGEKKLPEMLKGFKRDAGHFKDNYVFEFLNLPQEYSEGQLQKALISQMKEVILELGKDYLFMGEEYRLQVGNSDFEVDLLFYHRGLHCMVAFELKTERFKPEFIGKLNFYLEALDREVKKDHENPTIGVLLCPEQDSVVVEYALSRNISPTLVAQYQLQLPDKKMLKQKFHEIMENAT